MPTAQLIIKKSSVKEVEGKPNFIKLLEEYGNESAIPGMPPPIAKMVTYRHLESLGALHVIAALLDDLLIGIVTILLPTLPHYSVFLAVTESFFVTEKYRKTGAGLKLLKAAEEFAIGSGSPGLLVSAPFGGQLADVLPEVGYKQTGCAFFKRLDHAA